MFTHVSNIEQRIEKVKKFRSSWWLKQNCTNSRDNFQFKTSGTYIAICDRFKTAGITQVLKTACFERYSFIIKDRVKTKTVTSELHAVYCFRFWNPRPCRAQVTSSDVNYDAFKLCASHLAMHVGLHVLWEAKPAWKQLQNNAPKFLLCLEISAIIPFRTIGPNADSLHRAETGTRSETPTSFL